MFPQGGDIPVSSQFIKRGYKLAVGGVYACLKATG